MNKYVHISTFVQQICAWLTFLILFCFSGLHLQAQQNPYPFILDLSLGGGLIGNPDVNTTLQPEIGFSYMPGKFGVGLNAGLLSYDPSFDARQYTAGFENYTSVSGSGDKWSSFFFGIGPRFEFGSNLPVTFRSSFDFSLSYNSPPSVSVDFNDPDGSAAGLNLQLSGYEADKDYSKWSAALRPEFQMQFSPRGSERFAIQLTTGIQHRLSDNEFSYSQRDLSGVQPMPNSQEMFMQFEMAPQVQLSAQPPKTNFFTTVGIKIRFGGSRSPTSPAQDYNSSRSNKPNTIADIGDGDLDSDEDGIEDGAIRDNVREARNKVEQIMEVLDKCEEGVCGQVRRNADKRYDGLSRALDDPNDMGTHIGQVHGIVMEDVVSLSKCGSGICSEILAMEQNLLAHMNDLMEVTQMAPAQDYNASRSNKPNTIADIGDGDLDSDDDGFGDAYAMARSARGIDKKDIRRGRSISDDCDDGDTCQHPGDIMIRAKELGLTSVGIDIIRIKDVLDRCGEGICAQVNQHADERHHGVTQAMENPSDIDIHIEGIRNIVKEDVASLGKCKTDVCRLVLSMEEQLLIKMNRLSALAQIAPAQDYNSSRSNKPNTNADLGDLDEDGIGDEIEIEATKMVSLLPSPNAVITIGAVAMNGNPLYKGRTTVQDSPLYEGQANDGNDGNDTDPDTITSQKFEVQPSSYCVELAPKNSQSSKKSEAQDYNSSRSNKPNTIADLGDLDGDGFPDLLKNAALVMKRKKPMGRLNRGNVTLSREFNDGDVDGDGYGDVEALEIEMEIEDPDSDGDGLSDFVKSTTYSISKRSARTGRSTRGNELEIMESQEGDDPNNRSVNKLQNDVYKWSYKLNDLSSGGDFPANSTLTVLMSGDNLHFDLEVDPEDTDNDGDGFGTLIQNSSFSISKRSARTGRN